MDYSNYLKGVFYCLIATISWGTMFPVMTYALAIIDPFTFTAMRYTIAGIAFLLLLHTKEGTPAFNLKGERLGLAWLFGTVGFAGFGFLVFFGQQLAGPTGALTASIMMATMPLLGMLATWALWGVKPPLFSFIFISLSFFGVVLVITKGDIIGALSQSQNYVANIPLILGALCWVLYTVGGTYFPKWSPYRYTAITTALGLISVYVIVAVLLLSSAIPLPSISTVVSVFPHLLYMSLIAGFVGVLSWNIGNKIITPLNGVLFMDVVPITAFVVSALTGVVATNIQIAGAICTATALILNNIFQRQKMARTATPTIPSDSVPAPCRAS
jgi:drug/metabolite transporter (DMT)-like permease